MAKENAEADRRQKASDKANTCIASIGAWTRSTMG